MTLIEKKLCNPIAIPIAKLHPFEGHPYKVLDNEEMEALTESIHVVLFRRICHSPRREAYIASGTGISRLWQGCPIPTSAVACKGSRTPQESPSSQWEAVAGVAYRPRCHRARCCRASGQRPRRSLGQPPVPKDGRSVVMAARLLSLGFSAARGLC